MIERRVLTVVAAAAFSLLLLGLYVGGGSKAAAYLAYNKNALSSPSSPSSVPTPLSTVYETARETFFETLTIRETVTQSCTNPQATTLTETHPTAPEPEPAHDDWESMASSSIETVTEDPQDHVPGSSKVGVVSMLYGAPNQLYMRAIDSHVRHAIRHGYPTYVLRRGLIDGIWNKLVYILHVLVVELQKPLSERAEWLMWVDADSILINPALPLDMFLPPTDFNHIHVLASKDFNGLNAGMFYLRVHEWSVKMVTKALAFPLWMPSYDLGFLEQTALYAIFNSSEYRHNVMYQPRIWFNTYEFHFAYEGKVGDLLVHFPGLEDDRWNHMSDWLEIVEGAEQSKWEVSIAETRYPAEVKHFWDVIRYARTALSLGKDKISEEHVPANVGAAYERLDKILWSETDQIATVEKAADDMLEALGLDVGEAKAIEAA